MRRIEKDRNRRVLSGKSHYIDMLEMMQAPPDIRKFVHEARRLFPPPKGPVVHVPLQTAESILEHKPENIVHEISPSPALFIHGDSDNLVPDRESLSTYSKAKNPKKLVMIPEADHLLFSDPTKPVFNKVCKTIFDWMRVSGIRPH